MFTVIKIKINFTSNMTRTFDESTHHQTNDEPPASLPFWKRVYKILLDAARGFIEDDCYSKASALTFYSLLSIVPILAVVFGIAKGFGFEQPLEAMLTQQFAEQKEVLDKFIQFAYSWLHSVKGGVIAGVGVVVLLWSVFGLFNNVETTLNAIWKVPYSRPYSRKISDCLAAVIICPIFFITSSSITVFLTTHISESAHDNAIYEVISPFLLFLLKLSPYFLSWVLFTFLYLFMPNARVYLRSGIIAGILAGTAFQLWQWIYIRFQIGVASYGAIYGSFAALPLFLIWLQTSWLILLAGAEIAYEIENDLFTPFRRYLPLPTKAAALLITYRCIEAFVKGGKPPTNQSLARELGISLYHLQHLLDALQKQHILSAIAGQNRSIGYQPAKPIEMITFMSVSHAIEQSNALMASVTESSPLNKILDYLDSTEQSIEKSPENQILYKALS
jgi:membrane protein